MDRDTEASGRSAKPKRPQAGKRTKLSRAAILKAAMRIADADGQNALTMRQLGTALGVEAMSLYYYFSSRDDIIDGIVELIISEITNIAAENICPEDNWKKTARAFISAYRTVGNRHPGSYMLMAQRPLRTAAAKRAGQIVVNAFLASGIDYNRAVIAYRTMTTYVTGFVALEISNMRPAYTTGSFDFEFEKGLDIILVGIDACLLGDNDHLVCEISTP